MAMAACGESTVELYAWKSYSLFLLFFNRLESISSKEYQRTVSVVVPLQFGSHDLYRDDNVVRASIPCGKVWAAA
jgi:hypothetical protein